MGADLMRGITKLVAPIRRSVQALLARGVGRLSNAAGPMQTLQIELHRDEVLDRIEHLEPYGFTAHPQAGHEVLAASLNGHRGHTVVLVTPDRRYRKTGLEPGEVALYTDEGDYILFKRGGNIEVVASAKVKVTAPDVEVIASAKVKITSPLTEIVGNVTVSGTLGVTGVATVGGLAATGVAGPATVAGNLSITGGNVTADGIGLKTHVHSDPQGGTTGVPT